MGPPVDRRTFIPIRHCGFIERLDAVATHCEIGILMRLIMSISVKELAFFIHAASNIPEARKFYEGWLGLKPGFQIEFAPGMWWIEYDVAGVALAISNSSPETWPRASSVALEVADLDGAFANARAAGIPVTTAIMEFKPCRMFKVKDPDGNEIILHQRKA